MRGSKFLSVGTSRRRNILCVWVSTSLPSRCPFSLYLTLVTCSIVPEPLGARIFVNPSCTRRRDGWVLWLPTKKKKILPLKVDFLQQFLVLRTSFIQIIMEFTRISLNLGNCERHNFPLSKIHICNTDWQLLHHTGEPLFVFRCFNEPQMHYELSFRLLPAASPLEQHDRSKHSTTSLLTF